MNYNEQIKDFKLLGYLVPDDKYLDIMEEIKKDWGGCSKLTMWLAYELGVMHGKRAERARRAQR